MLHLSWFQNGDGFDVALAANRLATRGVPVWWCREAGEGSEAGDYLVDLPAGALDRAGLATAPWSGTVPETAQRLGAPRVAIFVGAACAYPYYAYYALCLARLGFAIELVDADDIAGGTLAGTTHLILPGGFEIWGLDRAERVRGADAEVRRFLASGGAAIGSCGGAYYLSAGRPGWIGTARAKPRWTHEYLSTGVGLATVALGDTPLAIGCPPTLEMPYYHGPVWDEIGPESTVGGTFAELLFPGHVFIANPLDPALFERAMRGRPAILSCVGTRGRAVLFSPHPEMGDLVRKYLALDAYARRYLPIRGAAVLRDTLRHYAPLESPCFRLVLNAVHALTVPTERMIPAPLVGQDYAERLCAAARTALAGLGEPGELEAMIVDDLRQRLALVVDQAAPIPSRLARDAGDFLAAKRGVVEQLCGIELALSIVEAYARVHEIEAMLP